jgi:sucrose-6-phosphate hydrolase SacC (GH32 family)
MEFIGKKTEEEFKQPNVVWVSDDDEAVLISVKQANLEHHRFYNKYDLQHDFKSDTECTPRAYVKQA